MMNATKKISKNTIVDSADAELKLFCRISVTTNWEIVAVGEFADDEIKITGRSYILSASKVRNSTATISAGFTNGSVIFQNCCHAFAPSTLAASYTSRGIIAAPLKSATP